jgi:hypothetical protein
MCPGPGIFAIINATFFAHLRSLLEICKCDHCGSEAEMVITCSLIPEIENDLQSANDHHIKPEIVAGKTKGRGVCSHCGNESEIWVEI